MKSIVLNREHEHHLPYFSSFTGLMMFLLSRLKTASIEANSTKTQNTAFDYITINTTSTDQCLQATASAQMAALYLFWLGGVVVAVMEG